MNPRCGSQRTPIIRYITIKFDLFTTFPFLSESQVRNQKLRDEYLNKLAIFRPL